jgi:ParB-like nuclease family protein
MSELAEPKMVVASVAIDDLVPDHQNARKGDVAAIAASLREFGQHRVVVVQTGTNRIIAGNHLVLAAASIGWSNVDVTFVDDDDDTAIRRGIADNATGDKAKWDDEVLKGLLDGVGQDVPGLDDKLLARLFKEAATGVETAIYPIVPTAGEHYSYVLVISTSIVDDSWLTTAFDLRTELSYKNSKVGLSRVITVGRMRELLPAMMQNMPQEDAA